MEYYIIAKQVNTFKIEAESETEAEKIIRDHFASQNPQQLIEINFVEMVEEIASADTESKSEQVEE